MILKDDGRAIDINKGLIIKDGIAYQMYNAKVKENGEVVDFTNNDKVYKMFPVNSSLVGAKEELTLDTIGNRTSLKVAGSTTYSGDTNFGGFTSSFAYICSLLMRAESEPLIFKKGISLLYGKDVKLSITDKKADTEFNDEFKLNCFGSELKANYPIVDNIEFTCTNGSYGDSKVFAIMNNEDKGFIKSFDGSVIELNEVKAEKTENISINVYYKDNSQDAGTFEITNKVVNTFNKVVPMSAFSIGEEEDITINMVNSFGTHIDIRYTGTIVPGVYKGTGSYDSVYVYVLGTPSIIRIVATSEIIKLGTDLNIDLGGTALTVKSDIFTTSIKGYIPVLSTALSVESKAGSSNDSLVVKSNDTTVVFSYGAGSKYVDFYKFINEVPNMTLLDFVSNFESDLELDLSEYGITKGANEYNLKGTIIINAYTYGNEVGDKHGSNIAVFQPKIQDPILNNVLFYDTSESGNAEVSQHGFHYTDVEYKNLNLTFANKGLTNITSTVSANKEVGCDILNTNDIQVAETEKTNSILAQTTETPTVVYINGMEAKYIKDATFTMEWVKEDSYNIETEKFIRNNTQYNWNWGANAVLNDVSRKFMKDLNDGLEHSIVVAFERKLDGKNYKFFVVSTSITGVVQEPAIARGELALSLSNVVGTDKQVNKDMLSNFIIAFHDDELV